MTDKLFAPEMKPWESSNDPRLAPSSYAASAVFGLTELAMETLHAQGTDLTPANVGMLTKMFARITVGVHLETGSGGGWESALHTRLRGALRTALRIHPDPVVNDQHDVDLDAWERDLYARVLAIAKTAAWLYTLTPQQMEAR